MTTLAQFLQLPAAPIAVITPMASPNVDFLSAFDARFNGYLIEIEGIKPAADDTLLLRLAAAGAADTGSNYSTAMIDGVSGSTTSTGTSINLGATVTTAGKGLSGKIVLINANDATYLKDLHVRTGFQNAATPGWKCVNANYTYFAANAVSGGRLYWSGASNFSAQGAVRIYGLGKNA